jgi:hypothetical protein
VIFYSPKFVHVFLYLNNSSGNKWFDFKIPSWNVYTTIPFLACFLIDIWGPSCLNFIMFWHKGRSLAYSSTSLSSLSIIFCNFFIVFWMRFGLSHPLITCNFQCVCTHPIDPMGIHFLHCVRDNKCTGTHVVICDTFATIVCDVDFDMWWKQLHALSSIMFNYSYQQSTLCSPRITFAF